MHQVSFTPLLNVSMTMDLLRSETNQTDDEKALLLGREMLAAFDVWAKKATAGVPQYGKE